MPFIRKSKRRLSRHVITHRQLTLANWQVMEEMDSLGLWCPRLDNVDVWLVPVAYDCYGWFRTDGDIYIPAVAAVNLCDFLTGQPPSVTGAGAKSSALKTSGLIPHTSPTVSSSLVTNGSSPAMLSRHSP